MVVSTVTSSLVFVTPSTIVTLVTRVSTLVVMEVGEVVVVVVTVVVVPTGEDMFVVCGILTFLSS